MLSKQWLVIANIIALALLALVGSDMWIRTRVQQGLSDYHSKVIMPMTQRSPQAAQAEEKK